VVGGVYLPAGCGRNPWGFASLAHCLMYGSAPDLQKGAKATAIRSSEASDKNAHPCPKPTGWMTWAVDIASRYGETVLDPFMGSGTTGVAAVQLGRKFIGIELEPKYFEIACERITNAQRQERMFA
jgi:DNA modification methylase